MRMTLGGFGMGILLSCDVLFHFQPVQVDPYRLLDNGLLRGFEISRRFPKPLVQGSRKPNRERSDILRCVGVVVHWLENMRNLEILQERKREISPSV